MSVPVDCSECGEPFEVPKSLRGGLANCPRCGKAVKVADGPEPLFIAIVASGLIVAGLLSVMAFWLFGPLIGGIVTTVLLVSCAISLICM